MTHLNVYLRFNGNCREAMTFYQATLGGELKLWAVRDSPLAGEMPPGAQAHIVHGTLRQDGWVLIGSDMPGPEGLIQGNSTSMLLECGSEAEIQGLFSKLAACGQVSQPLHTQFWGGMFGVVTDAWGKEWRLSYEKAAN
jgi:PhnB protein